MAAEGGRHSPYLGASGVGASRGAAQQGQGTMRPVLRKGCDSSGQTTCSTANSRLPRSHLPATASSCCSQKRSPSS